MTAAEEADRIARHLVGDRATVAEQQRYAQALEQIARPLDAGSAQLWEAMLTRPGLLKVADAGLAILDPGGPIRERLLIMLAILEASPAHADAFLPARGRWSLPTRLALGGAAGVLRAVAGVPLVYVLRRRARG